MKSRQMSRRKRPMKRIMDKCEAVATGIQIGRARRQPTPEEAAAFHALGVEWELWEGIARGRRMAAKLDQMTLELD